MVRRLESRRRVAKGGRWARVGLAVVRVPQGELALLGFLSSYMVCRRRTKPPSSVTWDRMEVTTCPLLRVTVLQLVFVLRTRLKRRAQHEPYCSFIGVIALFCGSESVVHALTVTTRIDHVTVHELLLAQMQQVSCSNRPSALERPRC